MHSRIIQIETHPIPVESRITSSHYDYDHWFTRSVADYVADDEDRDGTLDWLRESLEPLGDKVAFFNKPDGEGMILSVGFLEAYFKPMFFRFKEELRDLEGVATLDAFCAGELGLNIHRLESNYDDECGFYVENEKHGLCTFDYFMRNACTGVHYYFGGTLDYHF